MSTKKSLYNVIEIQSASDPDKVVDIRLGVSAIAYYENIFSPAVSLNMQVVDSDGSIPDDQGKLKTLYEGLPLRGKEKVYIDIHPNSPDNKGLKFLSNPLVVRSITGAKLESKRQSFTLNLISPAGMQNEVSFCSRTYSNIKVSDIAIDVFQNKLFVPPTRINVDSASNTLSVCGNQQKPFKFLLQLAKKGISGSVTSTGASAGYFVYETAEGMQFRSIDSLASQPTKQTYYYQEKNVNETTFISSPDFPSLDYKIIEYTVLKNQDVLSTMKNGGYATTRRFFDPITFGVLDAQIGNFDSNAYKQTSSGTKIVTLGKEGIEKNSDSVPPQATVGAKSFYDQPSRILTETFSYGTYNSAVTQDSDDNIYGNKSQSIMRYNQLFSQVISMLVPLNTNLHAGDIISILIPESGTEQNGRIDYNQKSGRYLIKELCHYFDASGSFTKLKIVRDTFGWVSG